MSNGILRYLMIFSRQNFQNSYLIYTFLLVLMVPVLSVAQQAPGAHYSVDSVRSIQNLALSVDQQTPTSAQVGVEKTNKVPAGIWKLPPDNRYLLWVELASGRLNLLENHPSNSNFQNLVSIPVSIGKQGIGKELEGDKKTPVGNYRFTSFLKDEQLNDYYGLGAYPINYPNPLDRRLSKTGHGIWLHGLPKGAQERPFLDSDGCVIIDNDSLVAMAEFINTGVTQLVLTVDDIEWVDAGSYAQDVAEFEQVFNDWVAAWESLDADSYLAYYADDFSDFRRDKDNWSNYKKRVNSLKSFIDVRTSDMSITQNLEHQDIINVHYFQSYKSSNYRWDGWKEQLWRRAGNSWQIIYEGNG